MASDQIQNVYLDGDSEIRDKANQSGICKRFHFFENLAESVKKIMWEMIKD